MSLLKVNQVTDLGGDTPTIPPYAGQILQVVSTTKTDAFTTTSGSYVDVTGLSVSITPKSASSKFLVFATVSMSQVTVGSAANVQLVRDSTPIFIGDAAGSRVRASFGTRVDAVDGNQDQNPATPIFLDSPGTASAVTYKVQGRRGQGGTLTVNRSGVDADAESSSRSASSITVMEVAG